MQREIHPKAPKTKEGLSPPIHACYLQRHGHGQSTPMVTAAEKLRAELLEALKSGALLFAEICDRTTGRPNTRASICIRPFVTAAAIVLLSLRQTSGSLQAFPSIETIPGDKS
jgi:hypothetical protein